MHAPQLWAVLNQVTPLPETEWTAFAQQLEWRTVQKGEHVLWAGEVCREILFCARGLFRIYYTLADGTESNKSFLSDHDFVTSYSSMLLATPSFLAIEALEASDVAAFSFQTLQSLYGRHVCWERIGRKMAESLYIKKESRERQLLLCSAEERYRTFLTEFPHLADRIPQYHIASYLGITPVSLSRIRRNL